MESLFFELGIVIISAAVIGVISYYLRQPLILAYIVAGVLIGPSGFGLIQNIEAMKIMADIGIMLMLFLVGLEMNPARLKDLGIVAFAAGIGQVLFTGIVTFFLAQSFGFSVIETAYLTIALTLSSTVIAIKLIYDKRDNNALYGQVAISILLVQDVIAILAILVLAGFSKGSFNYDLARFADIFIKGSVMTLAAVFVARKLLGYLYNKIATSHELLILFSLSWAFLIALISVQIGFSVEIGAFIAGLSLASLPYTYEINAKAKVLRDFFITIFFVALGAGMVFSSIGPFLLTFILLTVFVLIGNPIIVLVIMGALGYDKRNALFTGLAIANISEFSLIIAALGLSLGHISQELFSVITLIAITTMTISSYFMIYNNRIYNFLKPILGYFVIKKSKKLMHKPHGLKNHIILVGSGRMGHQILEQIKTFKDDYIVVDHDNSVIKHLIKDDVNCIFGDVEDADLLNELDLHNAEIIYSTLPNVQDNLFLIRQIQKFPEDQRPIIIVTADSGREGMDLFNEGADYVILKPYLGAAHIHQINKELYGLKEEITSPISAPISNKKFKNDHDYAKVLHNLNKMRLYEIKEKLAKKHITFKPQT